MKKKLKGLLSLWLAVVLVLGTPMVPVLAEGTDHGGHATGWKSESDSFSGTFNGRYFLYSGCVIDSCGAVVTSTAEICLNEKTLSQDDSNSPLCKIDVYGTLTIDDCAENQGTCSVPFNVESGGILNLERGKYTGSATVSANSVMNIKGGTYTSKITVDENGTLNISAENGRITKVCIDYPAARESGKKIIGKFNLSDPQKNYSTDVNGKTKIFDRELKLQCSGMEFATELIVRFAQSGAKIAELPTPLRKDLRGGRSHLRTVRDGLRHLYFILFYKPIG